MVVRIGGWSPIGLTVQGGRLDIFQPEGTWHKKAIYLEQCVEKHRRMQPTRFFFCVGRGVPGIEKSEERQGAEPIPSLSAWQAHFGGCLCCTYRRESVLGGWSSMATSGAITWQKCCSNPNFLASNHIFSWSKAGKLMWNHIFCILLLVTLWYNG